MKNIKFILKKIIRALNVFLIGLKCKVFPKRVFLFYTPTLSTNMGDQAIRKGQLLFLQNYFTDYKIMEIDKYIWCEQNKNAIKLLKKTVKKQDLITIQGGGYIGDLWLGCEEDFKKIVADFPKNKIVTLPNTAYYSDTENGRKLLAEDKDFYAKYKNVIFYLRDKASYDLMCGMVGKERCNYKPDMALMIKPKHDLPRKDILICTRKDHEKVRSAEDFEKLKQMFENSGYNVKYTDTCKDVEKSFKYSQRIRDKYLCDIFKEFAGAKLIVTDRLHGMILSAINKTPCIATDNISKKISGVYDWIRYLDYIKVMNFEDIDIKTAEELIQTKPKYDNRRIMDEFEKMADEIKEYWDS